MTTPLETVTVTASRPQRLRRPRALIRVNGGTVPGWIGWAIEHNSFFAADTFEVSFAASALPTQNNAAWFAQQRELSVEILAGFPADPTAPQEAELDSLLIGRADDLHYDPVQGVLSLSGRDLTGLFIDARAEGQWLNTKASAIVTGLCASHGLTPLVTQTSGYAGTFDAEGQCMTLRGSGSEWDLICDLAKQVGFVAYLNGQALYFGPDTHDSDNPYAVQWTPPDAEQGSPESNAAGIEFSRELTVSPGVSVTARAANIWQGRSFESTVEVTPSVDGTETPGVAGIRDPVTYRFNQPAGTSPAQLQQYAQQQYAAIVSHEMKLSLRLPGDNSLSIRTPFKLAGTGTAFDQVYFPRSIHRSMSIDEGYVVTVDAQNYSPELKPSFSSQ